MEHVTAIAGTITALQVSISDYSSLEDAKPVLHRSTRAGTGFFA